MPTEKNIRAVNIDIDVLELLRKRILKTKNIFTSAKHGISSESFFKCYLHYVLVRGYATSIVIEMKFTMNVEQIKLNLVKEKCIPLLAPRFVH